jgi:hypothetical protein
MLKKELENNSRQPGNSDSLNKSQRTLSQGVDEGGVVADDDDDG